ALSALSLFACNQIEGMGPDTDALRQEERIPPSDSRALLFPDGFEDRFQKLTKDDVLSIANDKIPYPDTYWPMIDDGINVQWLEKGGGDDRPRRCRQVLTSNPAALKKAGGKDVTPDDPLDRVFVCDNGRPSPLVKYMTVTNAGATDKAVKWE